MAALAKAPAAAAAVAPRSARRLQPRRAAPFTSSWRPAARRSAAQQLPRASASDSEQPQQAGQPPAGSDEQQAGGAALGPRDDDVLPDSLTGALEDASRATVEALERGVDRCVVRSGRWAVAGVRRCPKRSACAPDMPAAAPGLRCFHQWGLPPSSCVAQQLELPGLPQVEILLPELWDPLSGPVYAEEGDQLRFW